MVKPKLYQQYDRIEAIALFGAEVEARSLCDGQWVILPHVALCLTTVGDPPRTSHFRSGGVFCWVADRPYRVGDERSVQSVPREVVAGHARKRAIHLFLRRRESDRYLYVGELGPSCVLTHGAGDFHGAAEFRLSPALPSEVWIGLGGLRPGDLDHEALDAALGRLSHPVHVEERLWVLRRLVEYWHGPIGPEDGIPGAEVEGLAVPYPLDWWYRWAGRRPEIMSGQNFLFDPDRLRIKDGLLEFYVENQYGHQWGTRPEGDDPPVFSRDSPSVPWQPEDILLSEHLILAFLFEAIICHSPYGASTAWIDEAILDRIAEHIPPIPINPWRWGGPTRFHAKGGAFLYTMGPFELGGGRGYAIWAGAKAEHPLRPLKPYIDEGWEYVAV